MDLIETLMLMMTAAYVNGASNALPPAEMPTATPAPIVAEQTVTPRDTFTQNPGIIIITPEPPPTPTPTPTPAPTVTPNKAYKILRRGDKGDDVRRMQERLRELGFLSGSADGNFGAQTYSAVLAFQKANGLTRDGDAGPATLTVLFESPYVVPNLAVLTPTPVPTSTPGPDGLIPLPEGGTSVWQAIHLHTILLNNTSVTVVHEGFPRAAPDMWLRGSELMLSLSDMAESAGWTFSADQGERFSLKAAGYDLEVAVTPAGQRLRSGETGYTDSFTCLDAGADVPLAQGDVVSENGKWYISVNFLKKALKAETVWDEDENTLILRIREKSTAQSAD